MMHVPYKGSTQYTVDCLPGASISSSPRRSAAAAHQVGPLRLLAISAGTRDPALPGVPTIMEEGVPGFEVIGWFGLLATAGTPAPVIKKAARGSGAHSWLNLP